MNSEPMSGLLVVDKPTGCTSHDVVARLRRVSGQRRIGHGGTLDPLATGVLPVLFGAATRLLNFLPADPKVYRTTARFGLETTTGDIDGAVTSGPVDVRFTDSELIATAARFQGSIEQVPPMYSAKKVGGQALYRLARAGKTIDRTPIRVDIHSLAICWRKLDEAEFEVSCSPGTYVRSLVEDIGRELGCGATVVALRRLQSGTFVSPDATPLDQLTDPSSVRSSLVPIDAMPLAIPNFALTDRQAADAQHGISISIESPSSDSPPTHVALRNNTGRLVGIGQVTHLDGTWQIRPRVVLQAQLESAGDLGSPTDSSLLAGGYAKM